MQHTVTSLSNDSFSMNENNDCSVRSYSVFAGIPYLDSHQLHRYAGRKSRKGTPQHCSSQLINLVEHEGYACDDCYWY